MTSRFANFSILRFRDFDRFLFIPLSRLQLVLCSVTRAPLPVIA